MIINNNTETKPLKLNNEEIEIVNDFKYLGSLVATSDKIRIFQASVILNLLYGSV